MSLENHRPSSECFLFSFSAPEIHLAEVNAKGPNGPPHRRKLLYGGVKNFPSGADNSAMGMKIEVFPQHG